MAAGKAATVDSLLCRLICFILGKLQYNATSDNGDDKIGLKITNINWKERPQFWPEGICFVNPNTNLTTPEKWSMLFAALSCLFRNDIDTLLSKSEKFVFDVELMALEYSNFDILNKSHALRLLMKQNLGCLKTPWVKEIYSHELRVAGFSLAQTSADLENTPFRSLYEDLEQECKTGQRLDFLQKLQTFPTMKTLDADSALKVAKECLQYPSTRSKRSSRGPGSSANVKRQKTTGNITQNPAKQTATSSISTTQSKPIQSTSLALSTADFPGLKTHSTQLKTLHYPVSTTSATPQQTNRNAAISTIASSTPTTKFQPTLSSSATNYPAMDTRAAPLHLKHSTTIPATVTVIQSIQYPMQFDGSPALSSHDRGMQTSASPVQALQNCPTQTSSSPRYITQYLSTPVSASNATTSITSLQAQQLCTTTPVVSTQSTTPSSTVSQGIINNPLLSSSSSHRPLIPLDTSSTSLHDQARKAFNGGPPFCSDTWSPSQEYCGAFDKQFTIPDLD